MPSCPDREAFLFLIVAVLILSGRRFLLHLSEVTATKNIVIFFLIVAVVSCKKKKDEETVPAPKLNEYSVCARSEGLNVSKDTVYLWKNRKPISPFSAITFPGDTLVFYYSSRRNVPLVLSLLQHDTVFKQLFYPEERRWVVQVLYLEQPPPDTLSVNRTAFDSIVRYERQYWLRDTFLVPKLYP